MTWNLGSYLFTNRDRFWNEMRTLPDITEVFTTACCFFSLNSKQLIPQSQRKPCACWKIPNFRAINFDRFVNLDLQDVRLHFEINWNLQDLSSLPWPRPMKTRAGISQVSSPNRDKRKTRLYIYIIFTHLYIYIHTNLFLCIHILPSKKYHCQNSRCEVSSTKATHHSWRVVFQCPLKSKHTHTTLPHQCWLDCTH